MTHRTAVAGCTCLDCEAFRALRRRNYKLKRRAHTDAARVTAHIKRLLDNGWLQSEIVTASNVSAATVSEILRGLYAKVRVETAVALLTVNGPAPLSLTVSSLGTMRRIEALAALGWTVRETCRAAGLSERFYAELVDKKRATLSRSSADAIGAVFTQRSMIRPLMTAHRKRTVSIATKHGWPPPLAWDNIDDPDEQPTDWQYQPADRADAIRDLIDRGASISDACRRLGLRRDSLEKWCERHGMTTELATLNRREHGGDRWGVFGGAA